jgi:hypothetical protein
MLLFTVAFHGKGKIFQCLNRHEVGTCAHVKVNFDGFKILVFDPDMWD